VTQGIIVATPGTPDASGADSSEQLVELWAKGKRSANTRRSYLYAARGFLDFLADRGVGLRGCKVRHFQAWSETITGSEATVRQRLSVIKSLLSFGHRVGYLPFNVGTAVDSPVVPDKLAERILTHEEVEWLFAAADGRTEVLLRLLYYTGARVSELCDLQWQHVRDVDNEGLVVVLHGKGGKTRHIHLEERHAQVFRDLGWGKDGEYVLGEEKPLTPDRARRLVKEVAVSAGLTQWADEKKKRLEGGRQVTPHWLRHAHASHALDGGAPPHLVQATLGHASLATTGKYAHANPKESSGRYLEEQGNAGIQSQSGDSQEGAGNEAGKAEPEQASEVPDDGGEAS
jgi:integrase/recombinase XerD